MDLKIDGKLINCTVVLNIPRLVFASNMNCIFNALSNCGFKLLTAQGVFWEQVLSNGVKHAKDKSEYLLFVDYDSIFTLNHVVELFKAMIANPDFDIIVPLQPSRHNHAPLCYNKDTDYESEFAPVKLAHFGLTLIKSEVFNKMSKPWFLGVPNANGEWDDGKIDPDIYFWNKAAEHNIKVMQANKICIGHSDELIKWLTGPSSIGIQSVREFSASGPPDTKFRFKEEIPVIEPLVKLN